MSETDFQSDKPTVFKHSVPLTPAVHAALLLAAQAKRQEPTEIIQRALVARLTDDGFLTKEAAGRIKLSWRLVDDVVLKAQQICRRGEFRDSITLDAIHLSLAEDWWKRGYAALVGDDIYKTGNPAKGPINREIGFRVRAGIGGIVKKDAAGKTLAVKVLGEIIQSYTPMADFDREEFGPAAKAA